MQSSCEMHSMQYADTRISIQGKSVVRCTFVDMQMGTRGK